MPSGRGRHHQRGPAGRGVPSTGQTLCGGGRPPADHHQGRQEGHPDDDQTHPGGRRQGRCLLVYRGGGNSGLVTVLRVVRVVIERQRIKIE